MMDPTVPDLVGLEPYRSPVQSPDATRLHANPMDFSEERTTLTGQPIPEGRSHDPYNMLMGDGIGLADIGMAGANTLPLGYTNNSLVRVPVRGADLEPAEPDQEAGDSDIYTPEVQVTKKSRLGGLFKGLKEKTTSPRQKQREGGDIRMVMMSRGDYLQYWAKGQDGKFLPNVVEPSEGRRRWVENQLELNKEWIEKDPSLALGGANSKAKTAPRKCDVDKLEEERRKRQEKEDLSSGQVFGGFGPLHGGMSA